MATHSSSTATQGPKWRMLFPITRWLPTYQKQWLPMDLLAGVTVAAFAVPENIAYASLAGVPPQMGLYASLLASFVYAIFGTSRQLAIGPTSALSILVATGLGALALGDAGRYVVLASGLALLVGALCILARILRLGVLVNFISETVLTGFSAGAAFYIGATQLPKLFGIEGGGDNFFTRIWHVLLHLGDTNGITLLIGVSAILFLLLGERFFPKLPSALIVVILSIALVSVLELTARGVAVAGTIPQGLPTLTFPQMSYDDIQDLLPTAFACFLLSYLEGMGAIRTFASEHHYRIDADQELLALGAANLAAGVGQGFAVGGSLSRSTVNNASGACTALSGVITAFILGVVLLFLTGLFRNLPEAVLAAVVLVAVKHLIKLSALQKYYRVSKREFLIAIAAFLGVIFFGLLEGILIGAVVSVIDLLVRVSNPHTAVLGRIPQSTDYGDIKRHPENQQLPGILIYRVDAPLFYANTERIRDELDSLITTAHPPVKLVVLDLSASTIVDTSAVDLFETLSREYSARGITLRLAEASGAVRDLLRAEGLTTRFGPIQPNMTIEEIISDWQTQNPPT